MNASGGERIALFADIGLADRPRVGGKGASLGELERAGLRVPPGFVVTTDAFRTFIGGCGITAASEIADTRARIAAARMPDAFSDELSAAYARLCGSEADAPVAVRSSATGEDSSDASFAGLQDTFLWVRGRADVGDALRRCWASLYSDPAVAYRRRLALNESEMAMAVVIQRMVEPRSAGVMFTRSPLTGDPSVVAICASWGLGSTVVGGEVTPDEFIVNKITGQLQKSTISCKLMQHVANENGSGIREEAVPADLQNAPAVEPAEIQALAEVARRIEKHYGQAQDIEWAIDAQGSVFVLQSRPETVWSAKDHAAAEARANAPVQKPFDHLLSFFTPKK